MCNVHEHLHVDTMVEGSLDDFLYPVEWITNTQASGGFSDAEIKYKMKSCTYLDRVTNDGPTECQPCSNASLSMLNRTNNAQNRS